MLIKLPKRHLDTIVLGGTLPALLYSHQNNLPIIINDIFKPHRFEKKDGQGALDSWHQTYYDMSLAGLNLLSDKAQNVRIKDEEISVSTKDARVIKFGYEKLIIFDDENISGLPLPRKENKDFIVLDWMISRSCELHDLEYISTGDNLVSEVYFYPTERVDGNHSRVKDIATVSYLNKDQLSDYEYSDTYAKFKMMNMLKNKGLRGRKCGVGKWYGLNLEVERREIRKARMHLNENTDRMEFK